MTNDKEDIIISHILFSPFLSPASGGTRVLNIPFPVSRYFVKVLNFESTYKDNAICYFDDDNQRNYGATSTSPVSKFFQ